jgi:hypothetical protein
MMKFDDLRSTIERLRSLRAEEGRDADPFEIQAVCVDRFGLDGYREQAEIGVLRGRRGERGLGVPADVERHARSRSRAHPQLSKSKNVPWYSTIPPSRMRRSTSMASSTGLPRFSYGTPHHSTPPACSSFSDQCGHVLAFAFE